MDYRIQWSFFGIILQIIYYEKNIEISDFAHTVRIYKFTLPNRHVKCCNWKFSLVIRRALAGDRLGWIITWHRTIRDIIVQRHSSGSTGFGTVTRRLSIKSRVCNMSLALVAFFFGKSAYLSLKRAKKPISTPATCFPASICYGIFSFFLYL